MKGFKEIIRFMKNFLLEIELTKKIKELNFNDCETFLCGLDFGMEQNIWKLDQNSWNTIKKVSKICLKNFNEGSISFDVFKNIISNEINRNAKNEFCKKQLVQFLDLIMLKKIKYEKVYR